MICKTIKKTVRILCTLAILSLIIIFSINIFIFLSVKDRIVSIDSLSGTKSDCILVLGASVHGDSPSAMLRDRLDYGILAYESGLSDRLLMSGDHGQEYYDEVNTMKAYAIKLGIPSADIFMDHAGFSTYESIYRADALFGVNKVIIVTQKYHLYRALFLAKAFGIEAYGIPCDTVSYAGQSIREIREIMARAKDFAFAVCKPRPTYLGEPIPITGDGDVTNDH